MKSLRAISIFRQLRGLMGPHNADDGRDQELLDRFLAHQEDAAFEALVWRHGPRVYGLCRRMLFREQDAEDAFQATFLVFLRKANSLRKRGSLASWLYKVAQRICLDLRGKAATRRERPFEHPPSAKESGEAAWNEVRPILDEAILRLPVKLRLVFQLCYLDGKTCRETAEQLGCPLGTVLSRLAEARQRLQKNLRRRGVALSVTALAALLEGNAIAQVVPLHLVQTAIRNAIAGGTAILPPQVIQLAQGAMQPMIAYPIRIAAAVVVVLGIVVAGIAGRPGDPPSPPPPSVAAIAAEQRPDTPVLPRKSHQGWTERATIETETDSVTALAFHHDGRILAGYSGGCIVGWDAKTWKEVFNIEWCPGQLSDIGPFRMTADGKSIAAVTKFEGVRIWNVASGKETKHFAPRLHKGGPFACTEITADFKRFVTANNGEIVAWDIESGKEVWHSADAPGRVNGMAITPDGKLMATSHEIDMRDPIGKKGGIDRKYVVHCWDMESGKLLTSKEEPNSQERVWGLRFSADGKTLIAEDPGTAFRLLEPMIEKDKPMVLKEKCVIRCNVLGGMNFAANADASWIAVAPQRGRLRIYHAAPEAGIEVDRASATFQWEASPANVALSPDGKTIAAVRAGRIRIWDRDAEKEKK